MRGGGDGGGGGAGKGGYSTKTFRGGRGGGLGAKGGGMFLGGGDKITGGGDREQSFELDTRAQKLIQNQKWNFSEYLAWRCYCT